METQITSFDKFIKDSTNTQKLENQKVNQTLSTMNMTLMNQGSAVDQSQQDIKTLRAKYDNFRTIDQKAIKETNEKNAKLFKDVKERLRKAETIGSNSMTVSKNLDDKYTKINTNLKKEMFEVKQKMGSIGTGAQVASQPSAPAEPSKPVE